MIFPLHRLLISLMVFAACSRTTANRHDAGDASADAQVVGGLEALAPVEANPELVDTRVLDSLLPAVDGGACQAAFPDSCGAIGCVFPATWQAAQASAAWCEIVAGQTSRWTAWTCLSSDRYQQVTLAHWRSGEMPGVDDVLYFLYDATTGAFVQNRESYGLNEPSTCIIGIPGSPANLATDCAGRDEPVPLTCPSP